MCHSTQPVTGEVGTYSLVFIRNPNKRCFQTLRDWTRTLILKCVCLFHPDALLPDSGLSPGGEVGVLCGSENSLLLAWHVQ